MVYYIFAGLIYACILAILLLALIFGLRARRCVKHEEVTALARGFSPMDVQRIFIGKTYPRRLTRALIVHWAQMGYIRVKHIDKTHVRLIRVKRLPKHDDEKAIFFDRGTYVRERTLFNSLFFKQEVVVNINRPMFKKNKVKSVNASYAVREDEGVYSAKHYTLKVITFALSILPFALAGIYLCFAPQDNGLGIEGLICPFMMFLGMFAFRFIHEMPFAFRLVWSAGWVFPSVGLLIAAYLMVDDPLGICYAAIAILFIGSFLLIRFVDYREKNNLADYSNLVNYRKYFLLSKKKDLLKEDYYAALPFLYAFNIKFLVKRKFNTAELPDWYLTEDGKRGWLL